MAHAYIRGHPVVFSTLNMFTLNIDLIIICICKKNINVYCPECLPGGTIVYPGGQQKRFLPFGT